MTWALLLLALSAGPPDDVPETAVARFNRAVELQRQGALEDAAAEYRAFLEVAPAHAEAHANLGAVLSRLGRYEEAVARYQTALELDPRLAPARLNLGIAHYRAGQFAKAAEVLARYLESAPSSIQARALLGTALVELGRDAEAVPHLETVLIATPDDPAVLYGLGRAYVRSRPRDVNAIIGRLQTLPAGRPLAHFLKGLLLLNQKDYKGAVEELGAVERLDPGLPELHASLGLAHLGSGDDREAARSFEKELERSPQDTRSLYYLAYIDHRAGAMESARKRLQALLLLEPRSAEANALLGRILLEQGHALEAVRSLEIAVEADPTASTKRYLLARAYQRLERREEAAREFAEVQKLKDQARDAEKDRETIRSLNPPPH